MNNSTKFDSLITNESKKTCVVVSNKHHIFMSITYVDLFKTQDFFVTLINISDSKALFRFVPNNNNVKLDNKNLTIKLSVNGELSKHEAKIIREDIINNIYEIKFLQPIKTISEYIFEFNTLPRYGLNAPEPSSAWY